MSKYLDVYVFVSGDRKLFGLSINPFGANLPPRAWRRYDVIPISENYLGRYTRAPKLAMKWLQTRGYFLPSQGETLSPRPMDT
jgi:hypothetical protein